MISLPSITLSLTTGESTVLSPFGFLPVLASGVDEQTEAQGEKTTPVIPEDVEVQEVQLGLDKVSLLVAKSFAGLSPLQKLEEVVLLLKDYAVAYYVRYFVNNCLTVDGGKNISAEELPKVKETLNQLIDQNYTLAAETQDKVSVYMDNFGFRPFTGVRLLELPVPKGEEQGGGYDWDHLYKDPELSAEQLGLKQ